MEEITILTETLGKGINRMIEDCEFFGIKPEDAIDGLLLKRTINIFGHDYHITLEVEKM